MHLSGIVPYTFNYSAKEEEVVFLHDFKASQGYKVRSHLRKEKMWGGVEEEGRKRKKTRGEDFCENLLTQALHSP